MYIHSDGKHFFSYSVYQTGEKLYRVQTVAKGKLTNRFYDDASKAIAYGEWWLAQQPNLELPKPTETQQCSPS